MAGYNLNWQQFHSYRVFDEFLKRFVIERNSYVTKHSQVLDLNRALEDIETRFVERYDDSKESFEEKVAQQFFEAPLETKIVFVNAEYLWAMPVANISAEGKRKYVQRWFNDEIVSGNQFFFGSPHTIANPGPWYLLNKYNELVAIFRLLNLLKNDNKLTDSQSVKRRLSDICYDAIYKGTDANEYFSVSVTCGVHSALLHLSNPEKYESIISAGHKEKITGVFSHVISDRQDVSCREEKIKLIRERLYQQYEHENGLDSKYRWFFYSSSLKPLWVGKELKVEQTNASINHELQHEQEAENLSFEGNPVQEEGKKVPSSGFRLQRSAKLVKQVKIRDNYTCQVCAFSFKKQIVHVHHLDPLSERRSPKNTSIEDLLTLCPNCHYLAHYWLRKNNKYRKRDALIEKLSSQK